MGNHENDIWSSYIYVLLVMNHKFLIHEAGQGTVGSEALAPISSPVLMCVKCCRMS